MAGGENVTAINIGELLAGPAAVQQRVGPTDDLALKARAWFVEALNHPLWTKYRRESREDLGFYVGGDYQWSVDGEMTELNRLREAERATATVNHCQAIVDVLVGFERQNRFDIKASPQGGEDEQGAQLWSWVLKWAQDRAEIPEYKSEGFEDGIIRGMSCFYLGLDWQEDPVNGEIQIEVLTPGEDIIWDPRWNRYDLSDCRYVIRFKWAYVEDLQAMYPEHAQEIEDAVLEITDQIISGEPRVSTDGSSNIGGAYGVVRGHQTQGGSIESLFYDPKEKRALIMEVWYRHYITKWIVVNETTHEVTNVDSKEAADAIVASDPGTMRRVRRQQRMIRTATVIPSTFTTIEDEDSPFENDQEHYPFVPFVSSKKGDEVYGIIRNLKDPQRVENKRISQILDILGRYAAIKPMYEEESLVDPRTVENQHDNAPVVTKRGKPAPGWFMPPLAELSRVLTELALQSKLHLREVSGINTDLLGFRSDDTSGIAIARRQAQGQVISTKFFDNFKRTSKILGQRLARRCQQKFTSEEIVRLTGQHGESIQITLNPRDGGGKTMGGDAGPGEMSPDQAEELMTSGDQDNRPKYIKDVSALKYDIVLSEVPSTPSARQMALLAILEVVGKMPEVGPALVDIIVDLADVPEKQKIIKRLQTLLPPAIQAMEGIGQPPPGSPGAPGAPVGPGGPGGPPPAGKGVPVAPPDLATAMAALGAAQPGGPSVPPVPGAPPAPGTSPQAVPPGQPPVPMNAAPAKGMAPAKAPRQRKTSASFKKAVGAATGGPGTGSSPIVP